jgi:hypothetical protein
LLAEETGMEHESARNAAYKKMITKQIRDESENHNIKIVEIVSAAQQRW